jgi:hypothetical protein
MKRLLSILFIVTTFFACQTEQERSLPIEAIPIDAALIIETNDVSTSIRELTENKLWQALTNKALLNPSLKEIKSVDSTLSTFGVDLQNINPVFLSLHLTGSRSFDWLAVSTTENQVQQLQLLELSLKSFSTVQEHPYSSAKIIEVDTHNKKIFYSIHKELVFMSPNKILVEDAIRQLKTPNNLSIDESFRRIYDSSNKKEDFNLFIHSKNFDKLSSSILKNHSQTEKLAEWFQWDIDLLEDGVLMSGISLSHDSLAQELSFFKGNSGHTPIAPRVLPKNTALFTSKTFENFKQYQRKHMNAVEYNHQKVAFDNKIKTLKKKDRSEFENWIDREITWFLTENKTQLSSGLVIHITDSERVENYIHTNSDSTFEYRQQKLFKWNQLNHLSSLSNFEHVNELAYACILSEQLVVTDNIASLKSLINDYKAKRTLDNSMAYKDCVDKLSSGSNYTTFIQNTSIYSISEHYLQNEISQIIKQHPEAFSEFKSFAIQFNAKGSHCFTNAYLHYDSSQLEDTKSLWTTQLDAPIVSKINLVENHYNQNHEIVVQDENLNLYLISSGGEILWKRKFKEQILGSVNQIDLFRNKKLQLLFNTTNEIFLIDRKGRDVGSYPIKLKHETNLPLSVFDYEKNRNYRILVSSGKHHYMYNKQGSLVKGWKLKQTKSEAIHSAKHFIVAGKDHILLAEKNGTLNILNRKGEHRFKVKEKIDFSENKIQVIKGRNLSETRIVTIDRSGVQQNILFDGSVDNSLKFEFDEDIKFSYKNGHHILLEGNDLKVNGPKMNMLYSFENSQLTNVELSDFNQQPYLSITDTLNSKAYLFSATNDLVDGFPVYGKTIGLINDLDLDGKPNYIIGDESGMLYNYVVE